MFLRRLIFRRVQGTHGGSGKALVLGVIERDGEMRVEHVSDTKGKTVHSYVKANVVTNSMECVWTLFKRKIICIITG
jgi:hypothetical protein